MRYWKRSISLSNLSNHSLTYSFTHSGCYVDDSMLRVLLAFHSLQLSRGVNWPHFGQGHRRTEGGGRRRSFAPLLSRTFCENIKRVYFSQYSSPSRLATPFEFLRTPLAWGKAMYYLILPVVNIPAPPSKNYPVAPLQLSMRNHANHVWSMVLM